MKEIIIDFSKCKYPMDLHNELREQLGFPEWYGNNLDALWDMLTGYIETPVNIKIVYKPETKQSENLKEGIDDIIEVFKDAEKEYEEIIINCEL